MKELIKQILPYGDEFLMIDTVHFLEGSQILASKEITEGMVKGHFDGFPITPAITVIEGIGQSATLLLRYLLKHPYDKDILAYRIRNSRFLNPIIPPKKVYFLVSLLKKDSKFPEIKGEAFADNNLVAEVELTLAIVDKNSFRQKWSK